MLGYEHSSGSLSQVLQLPAVHLCRVRTLEFEYRSGNGDTLRWESEC